MPGRENRKGPSRTGRAIRPECRSDLSEGDREEGRCAWAVLFFHAVWPKFLQAVLESWSQGGPSEESHFLQKWDCIHVVTTFSHGTAQGKPMDMTIEGSQGASGPLWARLCPGHYSVPDPLGLHSNRGLWRGFWSFSSSVNSDPKSKCPQNVPFPQYAVCSQWRKLLSQEILKSPRLNVSQLLGRKKKKKRICLSFSFYKATNLFWLGFHPFPHLMMITA